MSTAQAIPVPARVIGFLILFVLVGCRRSAEQDKGLSPEAARLLKIAEDKRRPASERLDALRGLGELKDKRTVDRLLQMLPGDLDVVTAKVVRTLEDIGDPRALPRLRQFRDGELTGEEEIPGKINVGLKYAIRRLEEISKRTGGEALEGGRTGGGR
jgi:hypothetical protein